MHCNCQVIKDYVVLVWCNEIFRTSLGAASTRLCWYWAFEEELFYCWQLHFIPIPAYPVTPVGSHLSRSSILLENRTVSVCLSVCFNGHFPYGPGLDGTRMSPFWILLELRMMAMVVVAGAIRHAKLQSNRPHQQTITQLFTGQMADSLPVAQPTVLKHWKSRTNWN